MRKAFTLIEMLVVICIITVLMAASMAGYSTMTRSAERTKAHELVMNVATALMAVYQNEGAWPKRIVDGAESSNKLDASAALPLAKKGYLTLAYEGNRLTGYDKFGVLTPWGVAALKRGGSSVSTSTKVGSKTVDDHILRFAIDDDGDGFTEVPAIGDGQGVRVRATACAWCCSKDGSFKKKDVIKSWTPGMEVK